MIVLHSRCLALLCKHFLSQLMTTLARGLSCHCHMYVRTCLLLAYPRVRKLTCQTCSFSSSLSNSCTCLFVCLPACFQVLPLLYVRNRELAETLVCSLACFWPVLVSLKLLPFAATRASWAACYVQLQDGVCVLAS